MTVSVVETVDELVDSFEFPAVDCSTTWIGPATLDVDINCVGVDLMVVLELAVGIAVLLIVVVVVAVVVSGRIVVVSRTGGWLTTSVGSG